MGQETVGVYSFQGTLQAKVDRGQSVGCAGMDLQQPSHGSGEDLVTKPRLSHWSEQWCQVASPASVRCRFQVTQHLVGAGSMAFCPLKSPWKTRVGALGAVEAPPPRGRCVRRGFAKTALSTFPICSTADFPFCTRECCSSTIVVFILRVVLRMLCGTLLAALAYDLQ